MRPIPLQWLERNPEVKVATWKGAWLPWGNTKGSLSSHSQLERNPKLPAIIREKPWDRPSKRDEPHPPAMPREQNQVPSGNSKGCLTPFSNLRGSLKYPSQLKRKAEFSCTAREEPRVSNFISKRGLLPCFNSRGIPTLPSHLKRRLVSPKLENPTFLLQV